MRFVIPIYLIKQYWPSKARGLSKTLIAFLLVSLKEDIAKMVTFLTSQFREQSFSHIEEYCVGKGLGVVP